jgi:hypothetical protein
MEWNGRGREAEDQTHPPKTSQVPPEIIPPPQLPTLETPDGLHPNQYATRLLEEIRFPVVASNIGAVAAAIECEARTMGVMSAYEFVLECTRYAIADDCEITTFFFTDGKYRPERRNGNGRQVSTTASRSQRTVESLANVLGNTLAREIYLTR